MSEPIPNSPEPAPAPSRRSRFSQLHSQTYEMELLVSGALVFALLQLPGRLAAIFEHLSLTVAGDMRLFVTYGYIYTSLAVAALLIAFLVHLVLRAYWIGLLGLESVYPDGIEWNKVKLGPNFKRLAQARTPDLAISIERLDDLCSLVFSFAFLIVMTFAYSILMVLACGALAFGVSAAFGEPTQGSFFAIFIAGFSSVLLVTLIDRFWGARIDRSFAARPFRALSRATMAVSPLRAVGQIQLILQSRMSERRTTILILAATFALTTGLVVSLLIDRGVLSLDSMVYVPIKAGPIGVEPSYYRADRAAADLQTAARRPSIDRDVVTGPYLRLVLPYVPGRHNGRIARACPDLDPLRPDGLGFDLQDQSVDVEKAWSALECFVGLHQIRLDGEPIPGLRFDWWRDPRADLPGAIAYLDARRLGAGRHLLEIDAPQGRAPETPTDEDELETHSIPFWR